MIRDISFSVNVLRNGAHYASLRWKRDSAPNVYTDRNAKIKSSFAGTFLYDPNINYLSDELQPTISINGVENSLGIFRITTYKPTGKTGKLELTILQSVTRCLMRSIMIPFGLMQTVWRV